MPPLRNNSPLPNVDLLSSRPGHNTVEPLQEGTVNVPTRGLPRMVGVLGDQNASSVVRYHLPLSDPFSEAIAGARPRRTGFVAILSSAARADSVHEVRGENASERKAHVQQMTDGWKEDAKGVLIFTGIFSAIVASFIIESYKMLSPDFEDRDTLALQPSTPPASIITVNIMWLISLMLNIISALFATLTLQWTRRYTQALRAPRDHVHKLHSRSILFLGTLTYDMDHAVATTVMLLHFSVFLFLVGLVIFFFTINKVVATVVLIAVGLFGVVYITLSTLACIDRSCPYRTPLSDVWWSRQERPGHE